MLLAVIRVCFVLKVSSIHRIYTPEAEPHRSASIFVSVTRTPTEQAPHT